MANDTWQNLEQRFQDIGNRPGKVFIDFEQDDSGRYWWGLGGPVEEGGCRLVIVVGKHANPNPDNKTGHYAVSEIQDLLLRAGRLLADHDPNHIWAGADIFVATTIKSFRSEVCLDGERTFFPNAGRIFGMMAGKLILASDPQTQESDWPSQRKVARGLNVNVSIVARLLRKGDLRDNGETGSHRKVDPASVLRYCESKGINYECSDV